MSNKKSVLFFSTAKQATPKQTTQSFEGLSDTFAPPKDSDFVLVEFRLLSADIIVGEGGWNCSMFPAEVLREAVKLFENVPAVYNHSLNVRDVVGNVVNPFYQNAYTTPEGKAIPSGVNGFFKISKKRHADLVYDLMSEPSPIQSTSSMIEFEWEPSHKFDDDEYAFYWHLGDKINGEFVHMRATKILSVTHQGLVYEGADKYAKKMDGTTKEDFVAFAKESGLLKEEVAGMAADRFIAKHQFSKNMNTQGEATEPKEDGDVAELETTKQLLEAERKSKTDLEQTVATLSKEKQEAEAALSTEREKAEQFAKELTEAKEQIKSLEASLQTAQLSQKKLQEDSEFAKKVKAEKTEYAKQVYTLFAKGKPDEKVIGLIERAEYADLDALIVSYGGSLMQAYGTPKCDKCGNEGFTFRSSKADDLEGNNGGTDLHQIIKNRL